MSKADISASVHQTLKELLLKGSIALMQMNNERRNTDRLIKKSEDEAKALANSKAKFQEVLKRKELDVIRLEKEQGEFVKKVKEILAKIDATNNEMGHTERKRDQFSDKLNQQKQQSLKKDVQLPEDDIEKLKENVLRNHKLEHEKKQAEFQQVENEIKVVRQEVACIEDEIRLNKDETRKMESEMEQLEDNINLQEEELTRVQSRLDEFEVLIYNLNEMILAVQNKERSLEEDKRILSDQINGISFCFKSLTTELKIEESSLNATRAAMVNMEKQKATINTRNDREINTVVTR